MVLPWYHSTIVLYSVQGPAAGPTGIKEIYCATVMFPRRCLPGTERRAMIMGFLLCRGDKERGKEHCFQYSPTDNKLDLLGLSRYEAQEQFELEAGTAQADVAAGDGVFCPICMRCANSSDRLQSHDAVLRE